LSWWAALTKYFVVLQNIYTTGGSFFEDEQDVFLIDGEKKLSDPTTRES